MSLLNGQIVELEISDFGVNGEGIGKCGDFVVFVENAVPGDVVLAEIYNLKKSYGFGKIVKTVKYSNIRETPRCDSFYDCGGCRFLHINYETELKYKKKKVNDALKRIGGLNFEADEILGMEQPYFYRNKAVYHVTANKEGKIRIGFYGSGSNKIASVDSCVMFSDENKKIIEAFKVYMEECGVLPYNNKTERGLVKSLMIRKSSYTGDILVCIVATRGNLPNRAGLVYHLTQSSEHVKGITLNVNKNKKSGGPEGEMKFVWGDGFIIDKIGKYKFKVSTGSFFQVNSDMAEVLHKKVKEYAATSDGGTVIDAYAGTGTISIALSENAGEVIGIEINRSAILDAEENAKLNGVTNTRFIQGDTAEAFETLAVEGVLPECVILDPPRGGCGKGVIDGLGALAPEKIIYVSCDPATLARDLKGIAEQGYSAVRGVCIDMFARSSHVECVVLMSKANNEE